MKKSCIFLLTLFLVLWGTYFYFLHGRVEFVPTLILSFFGSLSLVMLVSSVKQAFAAMGNMSAIRKAENGEPFVDGKTAIAIGSIRPEKSALKSPLLQEDCVLYEYEVFQEGRALSDDGAGKPTHDIAYTGMAMCPCAVSCLQGKVRLLGFPDLKNFPQRRATEAGMAARFLEYLSRTQFESGVGMKKLQIFSALTDLFSDTDGEVRKDWQLKKMQTDPLELQAELAGSSFLFGEKTVPVGQQVVAIGRYSAEKMGILSQMGMGGMMNDLYPGDIASVRKQIRGNAITVGIFSLVFFSFFHGILALLLLKA